MKTCEQVAASVLERRDNYLAAREERRKAAKKYAAAGLLACAAVFAAVGLFRSGLLGGTPPVLPDAVTQSDRAPDDADPSSSGGNASADLPDNGAKARETTVPRAADPAKTTTEIDLSGGVYVFPSPTEPAPTEPTMKPPATIPAVTAEPEATTAHRAPETTARPTEPATETPTPVQPTKNEAPATQPIPTEPEATTARRAPETTARPTEPATEPPTTDQKACADPPTDNPEQEEPVTVPEETLFIVYVLYHGAVYAAEGATPTAVPDGAEMLMEKDAVRYHETILTDMELADALPNSGVGGVSVLEMLSPGMEDPIAAPDSAEETEPSTVRVREKELERTRITLLALPSKDASARIGVTAAGTDGMFVLEYLCEEEDFLK